jgi:multiple sugar transport system substrate-binding protein
MNGLLKRRSTLLSLICFMFVFAGLFSCGGGDPAATSSAPKTLDKNIKATIKISNYGNEQEKKVFNDADARFMKKYPNVIVEDTFTAPSSWGEYATKMVALIASGNAPDIISIAIEGTRTMVSKDILAPMDELIANDTEGKTLINDIDPTLLGAFKVNGALYEIPNGFNDMVIHYNTRLFKEAGLEPPKADWTWDDFLKAAKKLTRGEGDKKVWGFGIPSFHFGIMPWFITNDTYTLNPSWTESNLNDPKAVEAMKFVHSLVYDAKVSPTPEMANAAGNDIYALFMAGRIAMCGAGMWTVAGYEQNNFKDFNVANWPRNRAGGTVFGVGGLGIVKSSPNRELAWELIKEYASKDTGTAMASFGTGVPSRRSIAESDAFLHHTPNSGIFYGLLKDAKPVPAPENFADMEGIFMRHYNDFMTNKKTVDVAMAEAHTELSDAMKKIQN